MPEVQGRRGHVMSADGTSIAWFRETPPGGGRPDPTALERAPLILVHGTTADHTTFRVFGPRMATSRPVFSIDRRGRGGSGDTLPYAIEREFEDVAAVAAALDGVGGQGVDVFGHSYGGRVAMGAALLTRCIRRIVSYEGAVAPGVGDRIPGMTDRLDALLAEDRRAELLETFLVDVVDMTPGEWEAFRTSTTYPLRVAAAHTITRELRAGSSAQTALERYGAVTQPVLQVLGSESPPFFRDGADALARRLGSGRPVVIDGARHAAHHTHPAELEGVVNAFLDDSERDILRPWT